MGKAKISYLDWLRTYKIKGSYDEDNSHNLLLKKLYNTDFVSLVNFDGNRVYEALEIRREYFAYICENPDYDLADLVAWNMLELLISLAVRAENMTFDSENYMTIYEWFWHLLGNLGLDSMTNDRFDGMICDSVLSIFIYRKYDSDGKGGLFPLKNTKNDQRRVEIWYQLSEYINELF